MKNSNPVKWGFVPLTISKSQAEGTGMAMALITLLAGYYSENVLFYKSAIPILLITMAIPNLLYPLAVIWFSLVNLLSMVMPKALLTIIYVLVLMPVAVFRRLTGYDPLLLKRWKKDNTSVLKARNHTFTAADLEKPY